MSDLQIDVFKSLVGQYFSVEGIDENLILAEAKALGHGTREGGSFSLVFVAPESLAVQQGMLRLTCGGQSFELFLVPIGPFGGGSGLEAVFT